jgi:hypothetical protein
MSSNGQCNAVGACETNCANVIGQSSAAYVACGSGSCRNLAVCDPGDGRHVSHVMCSFYVVCVSYTAANNIVVLRNTQRAVRRQRHVRCE